MTGITGIEGTSTFKPSTEDITVMAGVIIPSASSVAAPIMTAKDFFKDDRFAAQAGITLLEIRPGYGKVMMVVTEQHLNAGNTTQGGAIFTLADLALAAAANSHELGFSQ